MPGFWSLSLVTPMALEGGQYDHGTKTQQGRLTWHWEMLSANLGYTSHVPHQELLST
jgi:hypothetical protein